MLWSGSIAFVVGGGGALIFYALHLPLPWVLGSITATAIVTAIGGRWLMPKVVHTAALPIVGVIAGSAFTPSVVVSASQWWDAVLCVVIFALGITCLGYVYFRHFGKFDRTTAFFASSPGGLGEMTLLGGTLGGDMKVLVLVHTARILLAVFLIPVILQFFTGQPVGRVSPFVAGGAALSALDIGLLSICAVSAFLGARLLRSPSSSLVLALLLSATVHIFGLSEASPPTWVTALMQVLIGTVAGARFVGTSWHRTHRLVAVALIWGSGIVALGTGAAVASAWVLDQTFIAMFLALAPGGMVEMTVITFALGIEVAFVVSCQVIRILLVLVLMPPAYRLLFCRGQRADRGRT